MKGGDNSQIFTGVGVVVSILGIILIVLLVHPKGSSSIIKTQ